MKWAIQNWPYLLWLAATILTTLGSIKAVQLAWLAAVLRKIADILTNAAEQSPEVKAKVDVETQSDPVLKAQLDALLAEKGMGPLVDK